MVVFPAVNPVSDDGERRDACSGHRGAWSSIARVVPASVGKLGFEETVFEAKPQLIGNDDAPSRGIAQCKRRELGRGVVEPSAVGIRSVAPAVRHHAEAAQKRGDIHDDNIMRDWSPNQITARAAQRGEGNRGSRLHVGDLVH